MEDEEVNSVLISWKGNENNVFLLFNRKILPVIQGYVVVWTKTGTFFFQFLVNGKIELADNYQKVLKNGIMFNFIEVEPVPEEFSQIKFLTVKEIEIIDQEVFGFKGCGGKVEKIRDYFQEAAIKIVSLLRMNVKRKFFRKVLRSIRIIQKWIRKSLKKNEKNYKIIFRFEKNFPVIRRAKELIRQKNAKSKTFGRVFVNLQEVKKKTKAFQLNLRVSKR